MRPTSERARQAYFNIVGDRVRGASFLDLFAGSGIFSFEAISRGATRAVAVDASRQNVMTIAKTASLFGVEIQTILGDAIKATTGAAPDLVYADPPYGFDRYDDLLMALDAMALQPGAIVAVEHRRHTSPFTAQTSRLSLWRRAEYGEVWITFFGTGEAPGLQ